MYALLLLPVISSVWCVLVCAPDIINSGAIGTVSTVLGLDTHTHAQFDLASSGSVTFRMIYTVTVEGRSHSDWNISVRARSAAWLISCPRAKEEKLQGRAMRPCRTSRGASIRHFSRPMYCLRLRICGDEWQMQRLIKLELLHACKRIRLQSQLMWPSILGEVKCRNGQEFIHFIWDLFVCTLLYSVVMHWVWIL